MTTSRSNAAAIGLLAAGILTTGILGAGVLSPPARAQTGAQTTPAGASGASSAVPGAAATGAPVSLVPPAPLTAASTPTTSSPAIQVTTLAAVTPDDGGVLDATQGGLGPDLWAGSPRPLIERALAALPAAIPSPSARALAGRVLMSAGTAPKAGPAAGTPRSFLGARLERLALMGDLKGADAMAALPTALDDSGAAEAWARLTLLTGDGAACDHMTDLQKHFADAEMQMLGVVCQVRGGATDGILLSLDMMREQGMKDDGFTRLAELAATGQKGVLKGLGTLSPETVALARAMARGLPATVPVSQVLALPPAALAAVADLPDTPVALRLAAGDRAAALGTLPAAALAPLYKEAKVSPGDLRNAVKVASQRKGADQRAILYQALTGETIPSLKAAVLGKAVDVSDPALLAGAWGELLAQELGQIAPSPMVKDLAPAATRLLLLRGRTDLAGPWFDLARQTGLEDKDGPGGLAYQRLLPMAVLGGLAPPAAVDWGQWLDAVKADAASRQRATNLLTLLTVAGVKMPFSLLEGMAPVAETTGTVPDAATWALLVLAGAEHRKGEVALLTLDYLGQDGPAAPVPAVVATALNGLVTVGLKDDARRLAMEAVAALSGP